MRASASAAKKGPSPLDAHRGECRVVVAKSFDRSALKACVGKRRKKNPSPLDAHRGECRVAVAKALDSAELS